MKEFVQSREEVLRTKLPARLSEQLQSAIGPTAVLVQTVEYGSIHIGMELVTGALNAAGLTPDDILLLLTQFTPVALEEVFPNEGFSEQMRVAADSMRPLDDIQAAAPAAAATPPQAANGSPVASEEKTGFTSRIGRTWWIANTSLVGSALIVAVAAVMTFQSVAEERKSILAAAMEKRTKLTEATADERRKLTESLLQRQSELKSERQAVFDTIVAQMKALESQLDDRNKLDTELLKDRRPLVTETAAGASQTVGNGPVIHPK